MNASVAIQIETGKNSSISQTDKQEEQKYVK
jgi:hypothetical protein